MTIKPLATAILGLSLSPWVQAVPVSVDFTLDPIPLSSSAVRDPVGSHSVGRWLDDEYSTAVAKTESSHSPREVWDSNHDERENSPWLLQGAPFGHELAQVPALAEQPVSAEAWLNNGHAHVATDLTDVDQTQMANAGIYWLRGFELQAHSSFTFSGLLDVKNPTSVVPATSEFSTREGADYHGAGAFFRSGIGDAYATLGVYMAYGASEADFSFNHDSDGRLALTITNPSDGVYSGTFSLGLGSYQTSSPVPEPTSIASLLAGLAIVGAVARNQRRATRARSCRS